MYILGGLSVLVLGFLAYVASRPSKYRYVRSREVRGDAAAAYAQIEDFHHWERWSPWEGLDPNIERKYSGPASGEGTTYRWKGNKKVGEGQMQIVATEPGKRVVIDLQFIEPIESRATTTLTVEPRGDRALVSWIMEGENGFSSKLFDAVMNMEKMIGKDFDKGLAALDEQLAKGAPSSEKLAA
jgi:hypothetical protein